MESDSDAESKAHVELCVKTERSRSLWSHLSSPEKKRVCELIGYVEGVPKQDKSKQYIGEYWLTKVNALAVQYKYYDFTNVINYLITAGKVRI